MLSKRGVIGTFVVAGVMLGSLCSPMLSNAEEEPQVEGVTQVDEGAPVDEANRKAFTVDNTREFAVQKLVKQHLQYFMDQGSGKLGPYVGDSTIIDLSGHDKCISFNKNKFDIQTNFPIWKHQWYVVTYKDMGYEEPPTSISAYSFYADSDKSGALINKMIDSGSMGNDRISITVVPGEKLKLTRLKPLNQTDALKDNTNLTVELESYLVYGWNTSPVIGGPESDWHTGWGMTASHGKHTETLPLTYTVQGMPAFEAEVKNDNKQLAAGSEFTEKPEEFYQLKKAPDGSATSAIWVTKPDMNKVGKQTVKLKVTNNSKDVVQSKEINVNFTIYKDFQVEVKNDNKHLKMGTEFGEKPEEFYNIIHADEGSTKTGRWVTKPDMNKAGKQSVKLKVENRSGQVVQSKEVVVHFIVDQTFVAEVKNDNKRLKLGTEFAEKPDNFYQVKEAPEGSTTSGQWLTKPDMKKLGKQDVQIKATNTSGGLVQEKTFTVTFILDEYKDFYTENPENVLLKVDETYYKDLDFQEKGETVKKNSVVQVQAVEFSNAGIPRLKTAKGYLTANKKYVQKLVKNYADYYYLNPGKVKLKTDETFYKDINFTQKGEAVKKDTVVKVEAVVFTEAGMPRLKTAKGYLTSNKKIVEKVQN